MINYTETEVSHEQFKKLITEGTEPDARVLVEVDGVRVVEVEPTEAEIEMAKKHGWRYWFDNYQEMLNANVANIRLLQQRDARIAELQARLKEAEKRAQSAESDREALLHEQGITVERLAQLPFDQRTRRIIDEATTLNNAVRADRARAIERAEAAEREREIAQAWADQFAGLAQKIQQTLDAVLEKKSAEVEQLEAALKAYADGNNWWFKYPNQRHEWMGVDGDPDSESGPHIARVALAATSQPDAAGNNKTEEQ